MRWYGRGGLLIGLASVCGLCFAAYWPSTGWLLRQQATMAVCAVLPRSVVAAEIHSELERRQRFAADHPEDLAVQIAWKSNSPKALEGLIARDGDRPILDAALLRALCTDRMSLDFRLKDQAAAAASISVTTPYSGQKPRPTAETVRIWDAAVNAGERLDPQNSYFPMLRAIGLFAAKRDAEACAEFERASGLAHYNDYTSAYIEGAWRLADAASPGGKAPFITKLAMQASSLFPDYGTLRAAARLAVACAIRKEIDGDREGGFQVRQALTRAGARMRTDASTIIGSYVGTAMAGIARSRPGGAPPLPVRPASETADQRSAEEVRDYETYLGSIGHQDEVPWVESAVEDRAAIKRITDIGLNHGVLSLGGALSAGAAEEAGALPLFSILAVALLGGLAAFVLRMPALQTEGGLKPFTVAGLAVAGLCGFLLMAVYAAGPAMLQQCIAPSIDGDQSASSPHETAIIHAVFALLMLAVPLAMTLYFAIRNRRAPMATGIVRGFAGSALRVCSLLSLLYLPAVLIGGQVESDALADLERCVRYGEGSYFSSVSGIVWPTYAPKEA